MKEELRRKGLLAAVLAVGLGIGFVLNGSGEEPSPRTGNISGEVDNSSWTDFTLQAVESGENFTISELERPVLVETFAVWCTTCSRQQEEVSRLHKDVNVTSVSLNVDQNENTDKIINHKQDNGFHWRYAIAPVELTNDLRNRFGNSIANPPSAPMILICDGKAVRLEKEDLGSPVKSSDFLEKEIISRCGINVGSNSRSGSGAIA